MRIKIELFGASREFSKNNLIEFNVSNNSKIKDIRAEMIKYLDQNFSGNENYKKIVKSSAFCSNSFSNASTFSSNSSSFSLNVSSN